MWKGSAKSLHNLPSEGAQGPRALQEQRGSSGRGAVAALLRLPNTEPLPGIFRGPSCPGLPAFNQSVKRSSQGLKSLLSISHGSALESGYCAGLIFALPRSSTPKEPLNIGITMVNVSELVISLFSVSRAAVGVVFVLFHHSYAAGLDEAGFDVPCMQIKPQAWSKECLFVWWGEAYFFRYLGVGGG